MAGGGDIAVRYNQNHNASDATYNTVIYTTAPSYTSLNFTAPVGMEFSEWNTEQDGSGISYAVGDTVALGQCNTAELYAIWEAMTYYVTGTELTAVADAIRTKGGTSETLEWPNGFVSAIDAVSGIGVGVSTNTKPASTKEIVFTGIEGEPIFFGIVPTSNINGDSTTKKWHSAIQDPTYQGKQNEVRLLVTTVYKNSSSASYSLGAVSPYINQAVYDAGNKTFTVTLVSIIYQGTFQTDKYYKLYYAYTV